MKIVINRCYGGFGLSALAVYEIAKRKGKQCYFFHLKNAKFIPTSMEKADKEIFFTAFSVPNPDEILSAKPWRDMSEKEKKEENEVYEKIKIRTGRECDRTDPVLIEVVKELKKKANGRCAELKVIEIPDEVNYTIEEYDGIEHIAQVHRTWR